MDFVPPYDQLGISPPGPWQNASITAGIQGSIPNADVFPAVQTEILTVQDEAGLTRDGTSFTQLMQAIRSGKLTFYPDTGLADALQVAPRTSYSALAAGLELSILKGPTANATATPMLRVGTLSLPLTCEDGSALAAGDLPSSCLFTVRSDGASFRVQGLRKSNVLALIAQNAPIVTPSPVLYVRPDGSDANSGTANTPAGAFATIAAAIAYGTRAYYFPGGQLTIQLGIPGAYAAPNGVATGAGSIVVQGDLANQSNYIVTGSGPAVGNTGIFAPSNCTVTLQGVTLQNTGTINGNLLTGNNGVVNANYVTFTNTVGGNPFASITSINNGTIVIGPGCIFEGSCGSMMNATHGVIIIANDITLLGIPNYSSSTAICSQGGFIERAPTNPNFVGSGATGSRYYVSLNGVITTNGGGANYFPGNAAGTVVGNGGQYA